VRDKNTAENPKPLIFIVDDVPGNLQVLIHILKQEEYRIAAAGNGHQALDMIPAARPDLVLLDIMMPGMDGYEVCRQLKTNPAAADIPIIFLTAKAETADIVKGFELGAVDYVTKPFNPAELLVRVKTHLELKFSREKLTDLIAARDKFFSIIAHDLRNPVQNLILSYYVPVMIHLMKLKEWIIFKVLITVPIISLPCWKLSWIGQGCKVGQWNYTAKK
jgi:two-component system sensor histidine kinase/response regulator